MLFNALFIKFKTKSTFVDHFQGCHEDQMRKSMWNTLVSIKY